MGESEMKRVASLPYCGFTKITSGRDYKLSIHSQFILEYLRYVVFSEADENTLGFPLLSVRKRKRGLA